MSFDISCQLTVHLILVILVIIVIIVTKVFMALKLLSGTGVSSKSGWIVIEHYGYESSFGANKLETVKNLVNLQKKCPHQQCSTSGTLRSKKWTGSPTDMRPKPGAI